MSEDTVQRILEAIEVNACKDKRNLSVQDWVAVVTLCIVIMSIGITAVKGPIVDDLEEQKVLLKETAESLHDTQVLVATYHGKREP